MGNAGKAIDALLEEFKKILFSKPVARGFTSVCRPWLFFTRYIKDHLKYEFDIEFDMPVTYPGTAPEIAMPELDGKTAKMYRGKC